MSFVEKQEFDLTDGQAPSPDTNLDRKPMAEAMKKVMVPNSGNIEDLWKKLQNECRKITKAERTLQWSSGSAFDEIDKTIFSLNINIQLLNI